MAFVRKKTKIYSWPVQVKRPSESVPGEFETTEFIANFVRLTKTDAAFGKNNCNCNY